jgi:3-oxoadipate enol-lactonase
MATEARIIKHSGCSLHYWLEGRENAPAIVLTHGATLDHHMFDPQVESLSSRFRVIRWDLPGHGCSKPMPANFTLSRAVEDLAAILAREKIHTVTLIGQSMGGDVCQEFLFRHPKRVQRIVLIGCVPVIRSTGLLAPLFAHWATLKMRIVPLARFRQRVSSAAAVNTQVQAYAARCIERMSRHALVVTWKAIGSAPHEETGYQLPCPTLMIVGDEDKIGNGWVRQAALDWARLEPNAELARIPGAGHITNMDAPEIVTRRILSFLS